MKYTVFLLFVISQSVFAGPAADRAQIVLDTLKGGAVAPATALKVLNAFSYQFKDNLPPGADPATMTVEEKAQFFLQQTKRLMVRVLQERTRAAQEEIKAPDRQAIDSAVQAEVDAATF